MTLTGVPLPDLDDLRWQGLVEEGRALIPAYAPDWTDHNVSDPGITLVELFAYLAELDLFTLNQLTPAQRRKLLALVGARATPALPAQAMVEIALRPGADPRTIAPGLQLEGRDPYGRVVPFRTLHPVTVQPGRLAALLTGGATAAPLSTDLTDLTTRRAAGEPLLVFGPDPGPGSALYLGFDLPATLPGGSELSLGVVPADPLPAETPHHSVRLGVELLTAGSSWARLSASDVHDGSRALTQEGRLTIRLPWSLAPRPATWRTGNPLAWMRIQIIGGRHDAAPALAALAMNAVQGVQAMPLTQTLTIAPGADVSGDPPSPGDRIDLDVHLDRQGRADRLGFAAPGPGEEGVVVLGHDPGVSLELAAGVFAGTGAPGQRIELAGAPVVAGTLHVGDGDAGWRLVDDFTASGRADADAVADLTAGTVDFGDGEHGRVPPPDSALLVRADLTAADRGNLAAGAVDRVAGSAWNEATVADLPGLQGDLAWIRNVSPAHGGRAAQTLAEAAAAAKGAREAPTRAVTLDDFVALALATPGTRIARAQAFANRHPAFGCLTATGVVTVLVLPHLPWSRPAPEPGLRAAVAAYLAPRRVLGTRIEVAAPVYVPVTVRATVVARSGTPPATLPSAVRSTLAAFFDPLTGGPDATGWPFGRDVYRAEVLSLIDQVPGVEHVLGLELVTADGESCGDVCIGPTGLVASGEHEIEVGNG